MTSAALHQLGRQALLAAWPLETGQTPSVAELQIAGAVASLESAYGQAAFKNVLTGESKVLNNWGAVQDGSPPCNGVTNWEATDTSPSKVSPTNPRGEYQVCFKRFAQGDPEAPRSFLHQITTRRPESWAAMKAGDIDAFSAAMHTRHGAIGAYYEGFGASAAEQIDHHAHAVERGVAEIAAAMGEPIAATRGGAPAPTGGGSDFLWQLAEIVAGTTLGVVAFRTWQRKHGRRR